MTARAANERPICVDLFAGVGGLALGFEQAGFDVVAAVEYDPIHAAVHQLNFPESAVICSDIRRVTGTALREAAGIGRRTVDTVIGGPPCQGFSLIGHRVIDDPRNELVFHFLRLVDELRPRTFMFENVAGMATGQHHRLLDELITGFQAIGYKVRLPYRILNTTRYGVPQDRRRLILLGARKDTLLPEYPAEVTVSRGKRDPMHGMLPMDLKLPFGPTVNDALRDLPDIERFPELVDGDVLEYALNGGSDYALRLRGALRDPGDLSYPRRHSPTRITGCQRANHTAESRRRFRATEPGTTEPTSRFFRLPPRGVCNTLRAGSGSERGAFTSPRPIHPTYARCISVREAARLHSYPDWFRFHRTIWHGFRQIGNSVPPLLARVIAKSIITALGAHPRKPRCTVELGDEGLAALTMTEAARHFHVDRRVIPTRKRVNAGVR